MEWKILTQRRDVEVTSCKCSLRMYTADESGFTKKVEQQHRATKIK